MYNAIGFIELNSIAKGIEVADAMVKTAEVDIIVSTPVCPGKYYVLVHGEVAAVESSVKAGQKIGGPLIVDDMIIPNVHPSIFPAITATNMVSEIRAVGILESFTIASMIIAADSALKAAYVEAIELRLGTGIGGKSFFIITGDVASVQAAIDVGAKHAIERGFMVEKVVIPSPSEKIKQFLL